jgi:hypothetical protein
MSTVDAIDLARRAIVHAAHRDAASGNIVRSKDHSFLFIKNIFCLLFEFSLSYERNRLGENRRKRYE